MNTLQAGQMAATAAMQQRQAVRAAGKASGNGVKDLLQLQTHLRSNNRCTRNAEYAGRSKVLQPFSQCMPRTMYINHHMTVYT
jgi:hypothetical protein